MLCDKIHLVVFIDKLQSSEDFQMQPYCLMVSGIRLGTGMLLALYVAACKMISSESQRMRVEGEDFQGQVTTNWQTAVLGCVAGPVFKAELDVSDGDRNESGTVTFIVPDLASAPQNQAVHCN